MLQTIDESDDQRKEEDCSEALGVDQVGEEKVGRPGHLVRPPLA